MTRRYMPDLKILQFKAVIDICAIFRQENVNRYSFMLLLRVVSSIQMNRNYISLSLRLGTFFAFQPQRSNKNGSYKKSVPI